MKWHSRLGIAAIVAGVVPTSTIVIAQQAATPAGTVRAEIKTYAKKAADPPPKDDAFNALNDAVKALLKSVGVAPEARRDRAVAKEAVQAKRLMVPFPDTIRVVAVDPNALAREYIPQIRPFVRAELHFIRLVCEPTAGQRAGLVEAAEAVLKDTAKQVAVLQQQIQQGGWNGEPFPDLQTLIEGGLVKAAASQLTPEQCRRYDAESKKRAADRKRAAAEMLVIHLDRELFLSLEQRQKLIDRLIANWDDAWYSSVDQIPSLQNFRPAIPNQTIAPILSKRQMDVWNGFPQNRSIRIGIQTGILGTQVDNLPLDEDFPPPEEAKSDPPR